MNVVEEFLGVGCSPFGNCTCQGNDLRELWRPEVARGRKKVSTFGVLEINDRLRGYFQNFCSERIHRLTGPRCVQISSNLADGKSLKSCVTYLTKISSRCPALASARIASVLKISFIQIGSLSAEL